MSKKILAALVVAVAGCGAEDGLDAADQEHSDDGEVASSELSPAEIASLRFVREEEKLARDVYRALDAYGKPFSNVQGSEQRHFDAVGGLLERYDIADPALGRAQGSFENQDLQALYGALVAEGTEGRLAALVVGCRIEELDIKDLEAAKSEVGHAPIAVVYDGLLLGSRNHLRAFYGQLVSAGGAYAPQYLDQASFDAIVGSEHEAPGG